MNKLVIIAFLKITPRPISNFIIGKVMKNGVNSPEVWEMYDFIKSLRKLNLIIGI